MSVRKQKAVRPAVKKSPYGSLKEPTCANALCKLRKAGCSGFEGCPGFKGK